MIFFKILSLLYPKSKAFRTFADNSFRSFVKSCSYLPEATKNDMEAAYLDLFPGTTRKLEEWEKQFGLIFTSQYDDEIRRKILMSFWHINMGGQTAEYLQSILQNISADFHIIENIPVRDPRDTNAVYSAVNRNKQMCCGNKFAVNGRKLGESSFVPTILQNDSESFYNIPVNTDYWRSCFFVCNKAIRNRYGAIIYIQKLVVDKKWKDFIECIILKIKPVHTTAIMFVEYE